MLYSDFHNEKLSRLGFGLMRLPLNADGSINDELSDRLVDMAMQNGVNYYDTAFSYINGFDELFAGRSLSRYPREKYNLATKFPGHEIRDDFSPAPIFEEQLKKCRTEYFDFYLMHNVYEKSIEVFEDPKWGIVDYCIKQKELGRIRHIGFSCHGQVDNLVRFLDKYGDVMEFCQIQLNYLDWTLQNAVEKYRILTERNIPVWVMEPVRGGKLASLRNEREAQMKAFRPDASVASWAFRWLQRLPNVKMILSGMSSEEQVRDNLDTFSAEKPLNDKELALLDSIAEELKNSVPCTGCRYCCAGCPKQLDIPRLMTAYNEISFATSMTATFQMDAIPADKQASACIGCGKCTRVCPQKINIPEYMKKLTELQSKLPVWTEVCKERLAAAEAYRQQNKY